MIDLKSLPITPGIYQYFDKNNTLLYIGKAKNIQKRVKSYFTKDLAPKANLNLRLKNMVSKIAQIHTIALSSEQDALILENQLIKQLKPKYNILLRDDKSYPYIFIDKTAPFATFEITRIAKSGKNIACFGPFPTGSRELLSSLNDLLPLVKKKSCASSKNACLFYQLQKCPAPCIGKITQSEYDKTIQNALDLLQNKSKLLKMLELKMQSLASDLLFEEASIYKERMQKIAPLNNFSHVNSNAPHNIDVFALEHSENKAVLFKLFMRNGKITSSDCKTLHFQDSFDDISANEIYTNAIINAYKNKLPIIPDMLILDAMPPNKLELEEFIAKNQGKKVPINAPSRGFKKDLVHIASNNAKLELQKETKTNILLELKKALDLDEIPFVIEVFDTSHHSFSFNVGAMISYENDAFVRANYRHYNLDSKSESAQMDELLSRRISSFDKIPPPNLWLIDGGKIQLNIAKSLLQKAGINIDVIALSKEKLDAKTRRAKGASLDLIHTKDTILRLKSSDKRLQFLQKLRDEAHRFAISFHKHKKTSSVSKGKFNTAQTQKLLNFYGSFEAINAADEEEIKLILRKK